MLVGCAPNTTVSTYATVKTSCPIVLFSSEHSKYITSDTKLISSEYVSYRAEINNYAFNSECSIIDNVFQADLSLLFVVKPDLTEESSITLPFYVVILNANDEVVDMQYYQVDDDLKGETENANYIETELTKTINDYDGLALRSNTKVTKEILKNASNLKVIGRAGIGVDNVDIEAATANGTIVMNTPYGNSITTAEHTIALMMSLARNIPNANTSTHLGKWEKSKYTGTESVSYTHLTLPTKRIV